MVVIYFYGQGLEPDMFGRIADFEERYPLLANEGQVPEIVQGINPAEVLCDHAKTGRATVHGVQLLVERKTPQILIVLRPRCCRATAGKAQIIARYRFFADAALKIVACKTHLFSPTPLACYSKFVIKYPAHRFRHIHRRLKKCFVPLFRIIF